MLDHFKCWDVKGPNTTSSVVVFLQDQFDIPSTTASFESVAISQPDFFCNPTAKLHAGAVSGIVNPDDHLTCYEIADAAGAPFQKRSVFVQNQFGNQALDVVKPSELCAPTQKVLIDGNPPPDGAGIPDTLDHFKCYDVKGTPVKEPVTLRDEFDVLAGPAHVEDVRVGQPVLLCNPARKVHFFGFPDDDLTSSSATSRSFRCFMPRRTSSVTR